MPRYNTHPTEGVKLLSEEVIKNIYEHRNNLHDKTFFLSIALTGGRISEIMELRKQDVVNEDGYLKMTLVTKKLGGGKYYPPRRVLKYQYNFMFNKTVPHIYYADILKYVNLLSTPESKLFSFSIRTGQLRINKWTKEVLGVALAPHVFRHYRFTALANKGISLQDIRYIKGSKKLQSVEPYIQAREQEIELS